MSTENPASLNATIDRWLKKVEDHTMRERIFWAKALREGIIDREQTGVKVRWKEQEKLSSLKARGASTTLEYEEPTLWNEYQTDVRGYYIGYQLAEKTQVVNTGDEAIVKLMDDIMPAAEKSIIAGFSSEILTRDGGASGYEDHINGLGTILNSDKFTTPTASADRIAKPASYTYAGLNVALGNSSGSSWTNALVTAGETPYNAGLNNDYPEGQGTEDYNVRSPLEVVLDADTWGTDSREPEDNMGIALRHNTHWMRRLRGGRSMGPQLYLVSGDLWMAYQAYQEAKFRNIMPHEEGRDLGFPETLKQDEVMIAPDYDMPAGTIYGINFKHMRICRWVNPPGVTTNPRTLFYATGWQPDKKTGAQYLRFGFWGNTKLWPGGFSVLRSRGVA